MGLEIHRRQRKNMGQQHTANTRLIIRKTKVATALPRIVSVFNALDLATWVAAACRISISFARVVIFSRSTFRFPHAGWLNVVCWAIGVDNCNKARLSSLYRPF